MSAHAPPGISLSEDHVRRISRSIRAFIPSGATTGTTSEDQLNEFRALLHDVFFTCESPGLKPSHRVAAWNTLCSLIDQAVESSLPEVTTLIWRDEVWRQAFELYLSHAQSARSKSSRQLLVTLTDALRTCHDYDKAKVKSYSTDKLLSSIVDFEDPHVAKASAQLLGHFLSKDIITLPDVLTAWSRCSSGSDSAIEHGVESLVETVLRWLAKGDFGSGVAQLLTVLLDKADKEGRSQVHPFWIRPLQKSAQGNEIDLGTLRVHILPVLFKRKFEDFVQCLQSLGLDQLNHEGDVSHTTSDQENLLYAALQTGKELGFVEETDQSEISYLSTIVFLPIRIIGGLLSRKSRSARLTGVSLLIVSHSATKPFATTTLRRIRQALITMFADVDADFRSEVFSLFQRLLDRIRAVSAVLARQVRHYSGSNRESNLEGGTSPKKSLAKHLDFLFWSRRFLTWELRPTASYQRHISSLKCLLTLVRSGIDDSVSQNLLSKAALGNAKWPFHIRIMSQDLQRLLLDLVLDPFDDVRQTASAILASCPTTQQVSGSLFNHDSLAKSLERAETAMLKSGRADQADGVAHIYALSSYMSQEYWQGDASVNLLLHGETIVEHLLGKLDQMINIAKLDLFEAVAKYPLHGLLTSVRYVFKNGLPIRQHEMQLRLIEHLEQVWKVVKLILCNDAPEGYMPDEFEGSVDTTKETLSYCWRALKEASLLLNVLVTDQQLRASESGNDALRQICDLCFTQLAELRHRGAFSTVAQTWITCCVCCKDLPSKSGNTLLKQWYSEVLSLIRTNVTINTRRSAGLPSLLCGVLIADGSGSLLAQAFRELQDIARQDVHPYAAEDGGLSQVHAMNCLKDVLKNSRLGEQSEKYVPTALKLAADALQSEVWAIRNCGLMLFRAVIDRLLGTDQSFFDDDVVPQKYISAEEYPELLDVILSLLPEANDSMHQIQVRYEGVFPALQLLSHTRLPDKRFEEALQAAEALTACPSWHVRNKAAGTVAALIMARQQLSKITSSLEVINPSIFVNHNALHGSLLVAKYIFIAMKRITERRSEIRKTAFEKSCIELCYSFFDSTLSIYMDEPSCFVARAAFLDCLREAFSALASHGGLEEQRATHNRFMLKCSQSANDAETYTVSKLHGYQNLFGTALHFTGAAKLRQAIACLTAQQIVYENPTTEQDIQAYITLIITLAKQDEDACKHFLAALDLNAHQLTTNGMTLFWELAIKIMHSDFGIELKCEAQNLLIELSSTNLGGNILSRIIAREPLHSDCNQRYADGNLQLRALYLDTFGARSEALDQETLQEILAWTGDCNSAIKGAGIYTLEAAADALGRIQFLWDIFRCHVELLSSYHNLCIAIYDLLNDDNEDIRLLASNITRKVLVTDEGRPPNDLEPIAASQKLLGYIITKWAGSQNLVTIAIERAFGMSDANFVAVADQLEILSESDIALFAEEKQNLYIDEAREVRVWSQVLHRISIRAISSSLLKTLALWVADGLDALVEQTQVIDGPLGWSSNADVFTLGLQVVYGVEVLLGWSGRGVRLPVKPSQLRRQLFQCQVAFRASEVNVLWIWEVERVLTDAVLGKLALVQGLLTAAHVNVCRRR